MAFMSNEQVNDIRAKADIVSIVGSYIPLTQRGKNYVCVCPFHDDHSPSMSVSSEKQIYKCFSCGATGNVFTFVSEYENVSFIEAVAIVANKCGMDVSLSDYQSNVPEKFVEEHEIMELSQKFYVNNLRTQFGVDALNYLKERGIDDEIIKEFGIGLSLDNSDSLLNLLTKKGYSIDLLNELALVNNVNGKNYDMFSRRITFPLWDKDGKIVGFSARIYRGEKDVSKYMNSRETKIFKKGETLEVWGNPLYSKDMVHVNDFSQMLCRAVIVDKEEGFYNVGTGNPITIEEQIKTIVDVFSSPDNRSEIVYHPEKKVSGGFLMDVSNAKEELGYEPKYSFRDLMEDYKKEMEIKRFAELRNGI